ncbi:hypothetical protein [Pseudoxanthomonas putridarboris]|uniref:DUF4383 domain-containing protein n=1 Tax=Pseudoxanthomonas putridarboris TaxID=752605 RepID=A0ABU9IZ20_9GAMM
MRYAEKVIGYLISALGLGIVIFGLLGLLDPLGAQITNDSDPFGVPPSATQLLLHVALGIAVLVAGIWLAVRNRRM